MAYEYPRGLNGFYKALYEIVDDPSLDSIISWSKSNKSFVIWNVKDLVSHRTILRRFYCCKFPEFVTEIEDNGFVRIKKNTDHWEFGHKVYFKRGKPELLKKLQVKTHMKQMNQFLKVYNAKKQVGEAMKNLQI